MGLFFSQHEHVIENKPLALSKFEWAAISIVIPAYYIVIPVEAGIYIFVILEQSEWSGYQYKELFSNPLISLT